MWKVQGEAIDCGLKLFFFFMYRPSCLIEAYARPESTFWCVVGCWQTIYIYNLNFIYFSDSCDGMNNRSFGGIPLLAGPVPRRWTFVGQPDWCELQYSVDFHLQNSADREVQQIQVQQIRWPSCWSPEFRQQPLGSFGCVGQRWICRNVYFPSGYVILAKGTTCCLKSSW